MSLVAFCYLETSFTFSLSDHSIPELIFIPLVYELDSGHMDSFVSISHQGLLPKMSCSSNSVVSFASKKTPQFYP